MKVRLTADMLRIRLNQSDVDALSSSGTVGFTLPLGGTPLRCALRTDAAAESISASFTDDAITVTLPAGLARRWMTSEAISLEGAAEAGEAASRVLVEKDLGCRHPGDAPDAEATQTFDHLRD